MKDQRPNTKIETLFEIVIAMTAAGLLCLGAMLSAGCAGPKTLEPGGVYAPTNAAGEVIVNERALALADASYKFAYETALSTFRFERDNREAIWKLSPTIGAKVKDALDVARVQVWDIDWRWATARQAYRENPTPSGLTVIQTVLAEIERIIPVIQGQLNPMYKVLTTPN